LNVITCAGYGNTGSSAITDYLTEFDNVSSLGSTIEFQILLEPDGVYALEKALTSGNNLYVDVAVSRFIIFYEEFINRFALISKKNSCRILSEYFENLGIIKWNGGWYGSNGNIGRKYGFWMSMSKAKFYQEFKESVYCLYEPETCPWVPSFYPSSNQYFGYCSKEIFRSATRIFITSLFNCILKDRLHENKNLMIDHLVPPCESSVFSEYVENLKVVVVDVNPVDLYLKNCIAHGERWIPYENVGTFINWYKQTRSHRKNVNDISNYFFVNFEDLVYSYEKVSCEINKYLDLSEENHVNKLTYFDPNKSIVNTNLEERFVLSEKLRNDVELIKSSLSEYLYNFPKVLNEKKKVYPIYLIREESDKTLNEKKFEIFLLPLALKFYIKEGLKNFIKSYFGIQRKNELFSDITIKKIMKFILFPVAIIKKLIDVIFNILLMN